MMSTPTGSGMPKFERFDLVSECGRFSPISRLSENEVAEESNAVGGIMSSSRAARPKSMFGQTASDIHFQVYLKKICYIL